MAKGVRASKQALIRRFHLSERLAVRAAALQTKQVDITAAVLESATPGTSLEKVLLHAQIMSKAEALTTPLLQQLAHGAPEDVPPLAVRQAGGWRTIALEEELMVSQSAEATEQADQANLPTRVDPYQLVDREDLAELFTPAEITELKVRLLTSADPNDKISALRKLLLSSAAPNEKGAILITALGDKAATVRAEAAAGLTRLGLNPGIADAAQALAVGSQEQKEFAAGELGRLVHQLKAPEIPVLLAVLGSAMETEQDEAVRLALTGAAREAVPFAGANPEHARELARLLVRQARVGARGLWPEIRAAVGALGAAAPDAVAHLLHTEVANAPEGSIRRFLFTLFADFALPGELQEKLGQQIAAEVARGGASEEELQNLTNQMAAIGEPAVGYLCEQLERAAAARLPALVRMIDVVCSRQEVSPAAKERAAALFARTLKTATPHLRSALLETTLPTDPQLSAGVQTQLAREMLASLQEFSHPRIAAEIEAKVSRMGQPALEPLLQCLERPASEQDRASAARALATLVQGLAGGPAALERRAEQALNALLKVAEKSEPKLKAELLRCAGRVASSEAVPPSKAEQLARQFKGNLRDSDCPYAILEALGLIATHPHAPLQLQVDTAATFMGLLQEELPELLPADAADQEVLRLDRQVFAYTEMTPILLQGLEQIYHHTSSTPLRQRMVNVLLGRWREASSWRLLWGPGNTALLLSVLGSIGSDPTTPGTLRLAVIDALMDRIDFPPAIRVVGDICKEQPASHGLGQRAARIAKRLLARLAQRTAVADDEADAIYAAQGRIAGRRRLGRTDAEGAPLREQILTALYNGLREGCAGAAAGLRHLADSGVLPQEELKDVQERLRDFERNQGGRRATS